ncbi:MAG: aldo/keto reductase [Candidatus Aminicenantales bacterium]
MSAKNLHRREFLKTCVTAAAAAAGSGPFQKLFSGPPPRDYEAKGLPTAVLGKTGVRVPRIGVGLGSRFCAVEDENKALAILHAALDHGFFYWDTAYSYRNKNIVSEERIGMVLKDRRKDVFLATKAESRTYDAAMKEFETSLKRLQTDHLDLYQIHLVQSSADLDAIGAKDGVLKALRKLKDEKATRFIGFTGHLSAEAMAEAARRYDFDTMLIALNHYAERKGDMENLAIPAAAGKNMGIMLIKVIRPRETVKEIPVTDLIRYGLSLPHVHSAVIGMDSVDVVRQNAGLLKNFKPLSPDEMKKLGAALEPFMSGTHLPWMQPGYVDGMLA